MSDVLVAGKSGQLAQALAHVSEQSLYFRGRKDHNFFDVDATARLIDQLCLKTFINTAAYTAVDQAESEPDVAYHLNAILPRSIAKACKLTGTKLLHISTDYVFNGEKPVGEYYTPEDAPDPINVYGRTKLDGENAVLDIGGDARIIRTSWLISQFGKNFLTTMVQLMQSGKPLNIVNDTWGTPTIATDLAAFLLLGDDKDGKQIITHYSSGAQKTWYEIAFRIYKTLKADSYLSPISASQYPALAKRGSNTSLIPPHQDKGLFESHLDKAVISAL